MDHKARAEALYAAFNKHDIPGILQLLSADVEWSSFSVDWALAVGYFTGHDGVKDFFNKLVGPGSGQQQDVLFQPLEYHVSLKSVHVIGVEAGYLTAQVLGGTAAGAPFFNNFDHTIWFAADGTISKFRANYNLTRLGPTFWPQRMPEFLARFHDG
jgi:ketosteroid isomerase-like protein